jgi:hypothetical protein
MANLSKTDVKKLKELRKRLEMGPDDCNFHPPGIDDRDLSYQEQKAYTAGVRDSTRLWRETWIFPTIDELIAKGEGRKE